MAKLNTKSGKVRHIGKVQKRVVITSKKQSIIKKPMIPMPSGSKAEYCAIVRKGRWVWTYTGRRLWPLDPRVGDFSIIDIAHACSLENRFGGSTFDAYSVAEHCVRGSLELERKLLAGETSATSEIVNTTYRYVVTKETRRLSLLGKRLCLAFLLHDAAEGCGFRDIPAPLKHESIMKGYCDAEDKCLDTIYDQFGVGQEREDPLIKEIDMLIRHSEQRDLQLPIPAHFHRDMPKAPVVLMPEKIVPWGAKQAELRFLQRFIELTT